MGQQPTVFVVLDDPTTLDTVRVVVKSMDLAWEAYYAGGEFLETYVNSRPGCLIAEASAVQMSGLELLQSLRQRDVKLPAIVISTFADTRLTVRAMQLGAVTVLDKPCKDFEIFEAIREALAVDAQNRRMESRKRVLEERLEMLSSTERQVLDLIVAGEKNKQIAGELNVSLRTVEQRRRRVFQKMSADSVPELVRMMMLVDPSLIHR